MNRDVIWLSTIRLLFLVIGLGGCFIISTQVLAYVTLPGPLTVYKVVVAIAGGISMVLAGERLLELAWHEPRVGSLPVLVRAILYTILAVAVAFQVTFLIGGPIVAQSLQEMPGRAPSFGSALVVSLISIQTGGLVGLLSVMPLTLILGLVQGGIVLIARSRIGARPVRSNPASQRGFTSLILGIVALPTSWLLLPGIVLALLAVYCGRLVLKSPESPPRARRFAKAGMYLGLVALAVPVLVLMFGFGLLSGVCR